MNNSIPSQSDSSQYQKTQGQQPISAIHQELCSQIDQESAKTLIEKFIPAFKSADGQEFNECLKILQLFFQKGYANQFTQDPGFLRKLMKQFSRFSYQLQKDPKAQGKMIYILSIIAMLIKEVPGFKFPFRIKFIKNFFLIDGQLLEVSPYKNNILAILAVIYENLSTQMRLIKCFKMTNQFKLTVLSNFSLIQQLFSIQLFNKTIYNMVKSGQKFTQSEIKKYGLVETVSRFISKTQMSLFMNKLQRALVKTKRHENIIITNRPELV